VSPALRNLVQLLARRAYERERQREQEREKLPAPRPAA
jgi:hypothetical protein